MKKKFSFSALIFSALISAVVCFLLFRIYFLTGWKFDLLKPKHWEFAANKWKAGWVMNTAKEMMFFGGFVAVIPVWICLWVAAYVLPLKKIFTFPADVLKKRKAEKLLKKSIEAAKGPADIQAALAAKKPKRKDGAAKPKIAPEEMSKIDRLRGKAVHAQPAAATTGTFGDASFNDAPQTVDQSAASAATPAEPSPERRLQAIHMWDDLIEALEKNNIFIFREMKIGRYETNLIAVTEEGVFIMAQGPQIGENWFVSENEAPPVWREGRDALASPLRSITEARNKLRDTLAKDFPQYAGLAVNACLVMDYGGILNPNDLLEKLEEWDVSVLRTGSCKTVDLPDVSALISYIKSQTPSTQELNDAVADVILTLMEPAGVFA